MLEIVGVEAHGQHGLDDDVVQNGADGHRQELEAEVVEHLGEAHLADDDGGQRCV